MGLHLAEIAAPVSPGKHCVLLVDQAGWHMPQWLVMPANIAVVSLPAKWLCYRMRPALTALPAA